MSFTIVEDNLPLFPTGVSFEHEGGPEYNTDVAVLESGAEQRNSFWDEPRFQWEVGYGPRTIDKQQAVKAFFHAVKGMKSAFRYKDWADYKSCDVNETPDPTDQSLGDAAAGQTAFQLIKTYEAGPYSTVLTIDRPVGSSIRIAVDGVEETDDWTVNETSGIVTRGTPLTGGEAITWGGEFHRRVRLGADSLKHSFQTWVVGSVTLQIVGLRPES